MFMPHDSATCFHEAHLQVGNGHRVYYAQHGRRDAPAFLVLHGGPGSGCKPSMLEWFDLEQSRVVLLDQRGAGLSTPAGETAHNRTADLVGDIERLRLHLELDDWVLVGGSWGATLALCYADRFPQAVRGLVLRGVFLASRAELAWFFQSLQALVPAGWAALTAGWSRAMKQEVLQTLTTMLHSVSPQEQEEAARRWGNYEEAVMRAMAGQQATDSGYDPAWVRKYRLQSHYLSNGCFLRPCQVFRYARRLRAPAVLLHGTHDWICPPANAMQLVRFMPGAELRWVTGGAHGPSDPAMLAALRQAIRDIQARATQHAMIVSAASANSTETRGSP